MELITFTDDERWLMDELSLRQLQILRKLARIMPVQAEKIEYSVSLAEFIGKGFDQDDAARIGRLVGKMDRIVQELSISDGQLRLRLNPEAIPLLAKMAAQSPGDSLGNRYGEATLALKMALGIKGDVDYTPEFDHENFDYGEDTGYMDKAFPYGIRWQMEFGDRPEEYLKRDIWIRRAANERLSITQAISRTWPDMPGCWQHGLIDVPISVFTDPAEWEKLLPEIAEKARLCLDKAREQTLAALAVEQEDGSVAHKPDILRDMRQVCGERDKLRKFFEASPETRQIPEWPLRMEPKGYFREFQCSLAEFSASFLPGLNQSFKWEVQCFTANLWLHFFREKYGIAPDAEELDDYGEAGCAEELREKYPDRAETIGPEYRKALEDARICVAWGLVTNDFRKIRAFVDARISHRAVETRKFGLGWGISGNVNPEAMRKCMDDAEMLAFNFSVIRD